MIRYFTLFITMFSLTLGSVDCLAAKTKKKRTATPVAKVKVVKPPVIIEEAKIAPININVKDLK